MARVAGDLNVDLQVRDRRSHTLYVRVTAAELKAISGAAADADMTMADFVRAATRDAILRPALKKTRK